MVSRVLAEIDSPRANAKTLGKMIEEDPPLTARLLRVANSALYARGEKANSADRAVSRLGFGEVRKLVTATALADSFDTKTQGHLDLTALYTEALTSATVIGVVAQHASQLDRKMRGSTDSLFTAGLLHDIGLFALDRYLPQEISECVKRAQAEQRPLVDVEKDIFGYDHAAVGALLLQRWRLSATEVESARWHHKPSQAPSDIRPIAQLVHLTDVLVHAILERRQLPTLVGFCSLEALSELGIARGAFGKIVEEGKQAASRAQQLAEMIGSKGS